MTYTGGAALKKLRFTDELDQQLQTSSPAPHGRAPAARVDPRPRFPTPDSRLILILATPDSRLILILATRDSRLILATHDSYTAAPPPPRPRAAAAVSTPRLRAAAARAEASPPLSDRRLAFAPRCCGAAISPSRRAAATPPSRFRVAAASPPPRLRAVPLQCRRLAIALPSARLTAHGTRLATCPRPPSPQPSPLFLALALALVLMTLSPLPSSPSPLTRYTRYSPLTTCHP